MKAGDQVQQRGFSAARGADNAEELAGFDFQIDVVEREQLSTVIGFVAERNSVQSHFRNSRSVTAAEGSNCGPTSSSARYARGTLCDRPKKKVELLDSASLNCLFSLFRQHLIQSDQIVNSGQIGHLLSQKTGFVRRSEPRSSSESRSGS